MKRAWCAVVSIFVTGCWAATAPDRAREIAERSLANTNADWAAAPHYSFTEHDVITKAGRRTNKTYKVTMIDGSPYYRLIAVNGEPLSPQQAAVEERKLRSEIQRRQQESPAARQRRVAEYRRERRQDHELMAQMVKAFRFRLEGEETVNGRRCFVLNATPRPGYQPINRDTRVLTGMRGKMWVDTEQYQWVRVHAEVFRPVTFGLFIAHVQPGTQFTLEQAPVQGNIWQPSYFSTRVKASILFWSRNSTDDETYSGYRYIGTASADARTRR
jgi:hypothetical protein